MAMVMLIGHGGWDLSDPPYAQVPRDTTINFYSETGKSWLGSSMQEALTLSTAFQNAEPNISGTAYQSVANYTLSPLEPDIKAWLESLDTGGYISIYVDADTKLCTDADGTQCGSGIHRCNGLFADQRVVGNDIYWMACSVIELNEVASGETPVPDDQRINHPQFYIGYAPPGTPDQVTPELMTDIYDQLANASDTDRAAGWDEFDDDWKRMLLGDQRFAQLFPDG